MRIAVVAGGVGGSKFLWGLAQEVGEESLSAIVNTGDDIELHGLAISPDVDIVTYTLAGLVDTDKGWGFAGDTFHCMEVLAKYGQPAWFKLGDRDLGTHLFRTQALRQGRRPTEVADAIRRALGVRVRVLPMTDDPVTTHILVGDGPIRHLHFQEYLVQRGAVDEIRGIEYRGSARAHPSPEVLAALREAEAIFLAPSNPVASIGPILAVPGICECLRGSQAPIVAISPVVGGQSLKGPTDKFLRWAKVEVSPMGVARLYDSVLDGLDGMLIDRADAGEAARIEELGIRVRMEEIVMRGPEDKRRVARAAVKFVEEL
ncbi:MAG: 2-phospho-L-lactate transferase [candidate division NC10 bacterium RIFCSPLOWO2_12_FULL_66_18]|nr:MAG: 2-phospho-L-lactate transferase [candidate division NC10 bacterium RIFCSPLOWO2_02_FULL_66_22]OGB96317.1 MAG: 2-phospho-L-lactate transferase [candidate division NC10 bacterium RIFCSPLOWO2_12_FULL_66_18]